MLEASPETKALLKKCFKELRLPTVLDCYEDYGAKAGAEGWSYDHYLLGLLEQECQVRRENRISRLLRESKLPLEKSLPAFDLKRLPTKVASQTRALLNGSFLDRRENVLIFGNPGSGKTHLLCAIGQELVRQGRQILFTSCSFLVQALLSAKKDLNRFGISIGSLNLRR